MDLTHQKKKEKKNIEKNEFYIENISQAWID
jgi:hypothetical protein